MNFAFLSGYALWPLALIQAIALLALAPLFAGFSRVLRARMHNRQGPGLLQEYRDIRKLLGRQSIAPAVSGLAFRSMPYLLTGVLLAIATALPKVTLVSPLGEGGELLTII